MRTCFRDAAAPRDLGLLAGAVFLSAAGDLLALITLALAVHDATGSGWAVSAYFAATMTPVIVLAPVAGRIADGAESVRVLAVASIVQAVVALGLAFALGDLAAILALSALLAAGSAISQPAEFALVPAVAGERALTRANGVMESARYAGYAAGPVLAAGIAALAEPRAALLVNAVSFLAIAGAAAMIRTRRPPVLERGSGERPREGIVLLWRDPLLRVTVLAATGALLFISASMTIEVFYVKEVLGAGDLGYALLTLAWMTGMIAGATGLAPAVDGRRLGVAALVALALQGAGMASQTAWTVLPMALAGYLAGGLGHGVKNTLMRTLIQHRVPERAHGRAFAAYNACRNTAELLALAAGGLLVTAIGARTALLIAGLGPVVAGLAGLAALRRHTVPFPLTLSYRPAHEGAKS